MAGIPATSSASTLLLSDNYNDAPNGATSTFNDNLASTQAGTLATTTYSVQGSSYVAQHSNGSHLLVATANDGNGNGSASLDNNFAIQANGANQALQVTFNFIGVDSYADTSRWVQFNVGNAQNLDVGNGGVGYGIIFRVSGVTGIPGGTWAPNDLVTITLTDTAGVGSAFNGNGSKAIVSVGATNYGTFTLAQQTNAFLTFSAFNYGNDQFGLGTFDNLNVSLVPEPGAVLLGGLGMLALLRRRR
jgi:MYXO-CTERM domain-containing protein